MNAAALTIADINKLTATEIDALTTDDLNALDGEAFLALLVRNQKIGEEIEAARSHT